MEEGKERGLERKGERNGFIAVKGSLTITSTHDNWPRYCLYSQHSGRQEQMGLPEFQASLVYITNSRPEHEKKKVHMRMQDSK